MAATTTALEFANAFLAAKLEIWQGQLQDLAQRLADGRALRTAVRVSRQDEAQLQAALQQGLPDDTDPALVNLVTILATEDQLELLPDIAAALQSRLAGAVGPAQAQVTSAIALSEAQQAALRAQLAAEHGQELDVQFLVDASLIGGLRIRVGDNLTDLSVSSSLQALREQVMASV